MRFLLPLVAAACIAPVAAQDTTIDRCRIRPGTQCLARSSRKWSFRHANVAGCIGCPKP